MIVQRSGRQGSAMGGWSSTRTVGSESPISGTTRVHVPSRAVQQLHVPLLSGASSVSEPSVSEPSSGGASSWVPTHTSWAPASSG